MRTMNQDLAHQVVMDGFNVRQCNNPSAVVMSRIRRLEAGQEGEGGKDGRKGGGKGGGKDRSPPRRRSRSRRRSRKRSKSPKKRRRRRKRKRARSATPSSYSGGSSYSGSR
eukprot:gnl/TRDRNA2_/TRDRNA2_128088_c0_seq1.p1 gnl/TRDRNA2_/TRDRNA2_128088_c0~~gnl/TRDRNA2_/TRDRNA2_128088_c0_seq1.p1  ORF type:complete len:111 (+),score=8.86 gnl/TRDRNA2_/TRDRNA2_128088_c0_seq1:156-488(+)